ncbi:hypothetical protein [Inquilinus limosus]|uniref:Uncharacterized protein n=1 Tax=Inquilinus limosus MP06 TaxID=1398085 RepID=A0A0A0D9Y0_9PROT|nr:hypothetical protein [Inquilinus limosus]KGM34693.1 hypothetical protein P409_08830 [Inquilinus limosus MP06]
MPARKNPGGGVKQDKIWRDAIHRAVKRRMGGEGNPQALDQLADQLVAAGLGGDVSALKEIGDRLDGKPKQQVEHSGEDGGPLRVEVIRFSAGD